MSVYVFAATAAEARVARRLASLERNARRAPPAVVISGVGPAAARVAAVRQIEELRKGGAGDRDAAVFCVIGTCGGLSSALAAGSIALYTSCLTTADRGAPLPAESLPALVERIASALAARQIPYAKVVGITSPKVAALYSEKVRLAQRHASVVDMESYEILAAARGAGIAGVVVRAVSDPLHLDVPDFTPAIRADGSVMGLRTMRIALRSPVSTARLMAAQRHALRNLRQALEAIWTSDCLRPVIT